MNDPRLKDGALSEERSIEGRSSRAAAKSPSVTATGLPPISNRNESQANNL